jgi:integrase
MQRTEAGKITKRIVRVKGHEYERFVVDFGTVDGRRNRRTFKTEGEAQAAIEKEGILARRIGKQARKLSDADLFDAAKALDVLAREVTLETAARFWMEHNRPGNRALTIENAVEEFLQSRRGKGCRPVTVRGYGDKLGLFARDMDGRKLAQTTVSVVDAWLDKRAFTPGTKGAYLRNLRAFFGWACKRRYMVENPALAVDLPYRDKSRVTYLTVEDCELLLRTAERDRPEIVPYIALGMFGGLRPSEIHGHKTGHAPLDWRCILFDKALIDVEPEQTKTRDGRHVTMTPNLFAWLLPYCQTEGPIFYTRSAFESVLRKSGVPYGKDILRHTAGTYMFARDRNDGAVAAQLGDTIKTVRTHYVNPRVEQSAAARFWAIMPGDK